MSTLPELKISVEEEVKRCIEVANQRFPNRNFKMPRIEFTLVGTKAGTANSSGYCININSVLLVENEKQMISNTVPHEVAHLIDAILHPETRDCSFKYNLFSGRRGSRTKRSIHGPTWKSVMRMLGVDPSRTHQMDVKNATTKTRNRFYYECPTCHRMNTAGPKHHKMLQRGMKFKSGICGHSFTFADYKGHRTI